MRKTDRERKSERWQKNDERKRDRFRDGQKLWFSQREKKWMKDWKDWERMRQTSKVQSKGIKCERQKEWKGQIGIKKRRKGHNWEKSIKNEVRGK